jgi:hypothetical protein
MALTMEITMALLSPLLPLLQPKARARPL